jgi:hypothetical protein
MIPVGQPYRPAGPLDARSILITTILGVTAAVIGAAIVWLWEWSPIPTLVVITSAIQGVGVGLVMAFAVGRLRMRNPRLVGVVAFACGVLSVGLVHYGHYLHLVTAVSNELRDDVAQDKSMPEEKRRELLARLDADPASVIDPFLKLKTGHSGFIGSLFLRNEQGVMLRRTKASGLFLWFLWGVEAFAAAVAAAAIASTRAAQPFCEDCGFWCEKQPDLFTLPGACAAPLVEAVRADDPARVVKLRSDPPPDDATGRVGVTLHACPGCDQCFLDVWHRVSTGKETKLSELLKQQRVSPIMVAAVRTAPPTADEAEPVLEVEDEGDAVDEPRRS